MIQKKNNSFNIRTLALMLGTAILLYLVWRLSDVIILIITAAVIAATLNPSVKWLERKKFSRKISSTIVTILMVLPMIFVLAILIPIFLSEISGIAKTVTDTINNYPLLPKLLRDINISQYTQDAGKYLLASTSLLTNFFASIIILVFSIYYLLIDSEKIYRFFAIFIPENSRSKINRMINDLSLISGQYIRGNIFISLICGTTMFIGLFLLHVPGAAALAVFAGITDLLPLVGATIGAIPAAILAFTVSPITGFLTLVLFWVYQEIENDYIIPRVYHKALNIIPFFSFISVIAGALLFGIAGAFLALPIAASVPTIFNYFSTETKIES